MTDALKPCPSPWCADSTPIDSVCTPTMGGQVAYIVQCGYCNLEGPSRSTPEEARAVWNKRATPIRELEGALLLQFFVNWFEPAGPGIGKETPHDVIADAREYVERALHPELYQNGDQK